MPSVRRTPIEITWKSILKVMVAIALAWLWLQLYQITLLLIVAVLLAVTLNPAVEWLQHRGAARWVASTVVSFILLALVVGFFWLTWSSLSEQATYLAKQVTGRQAELLDRLPVWMRNSIQPPTTGDVTSYAAPYALKLAQSTTTALLVVAAYVVYNIVESYLISPWAYGNRLKLSNVAIILAFAAGAEIAGVIGALIALPFAAIYPSIERIWLRGKLADDTVREHKAIERKAG
jgi:predicted PurR-regulated permease PerM